MKRARLNLGLMVVAAGLGAAVFFSQKKDEKGPPLTGLAADAVTHIALEHPGQPGIRLEKRDARWYFGAPVTAEVDEFEINALLGLATAEAKESVTGATLKNLGLDPPKYTVTLNDVQIAVGDVEPIQFRRYVKVGDVVSLIEDPPSAALDADYSDLVAKGVLPAGSEIASIELPKLKLAKADGKWALTPADPNAGADQMQRLADAWKNARAMWNERAAGPAPKGERVKVTFADGTAREFVVAARDPQFKLHRPDLGVNYVLSKALADEMLQLPPPAAPAPAEEKKEENN